MTTLEKILQEIEELSGEHPYKIQGKYETYSQYNEAWQDCISRVEGIIERNISEKNDGWIPCSERMPEKPKENPEFENKKLDIYLVSIHGTKYPFRAFWNGESFTDGWTKVDVLAWRKLPERYRKDGE